MKLKEYKYKINGTKFTVGVGEIIDNVVHVEVNGMPYNVELDRAPSTSMPKVKRPAAAPRKDSGEKVIATPQPVAGNPQAVKSPLPGTIMNFKVKVGDKVKSGDTVCILEAMKMENDIHTQKSGVVKSILVNVGDSVLEGSDIMIIE